MSASVPAVIRLAGRYSDGVERWTIDARMDDADGLEFEDRKRTPVDIRIGADRFRAGVRTTRKPSQVYLCANMLDSAGEKVRLADVLMVAGFHRNQRIRIGRGNDGLNVEPAA